MPHSKPTQSSTFIVPKHFTKQINTSLIKTENKKLMFYLTEIYLKHCSGVSKHNKMSNTKGLLENAHMFVLKRLSVLYFSFQKVNTEGEIPEISMTISVIYCMWVQNLVPHYMGRKKMEAI
jgi:hypothetical protein